ncbi:unnamed protein product, partial [Mesorhabditis belari]|uniref:Mitochondrial potassium channel ATP-binding subunit n=1 Tax=Mesorhabditis belari TaxID=2138241 RepID=A0AAF3FI76_9BILA
MLHSFSLFRQVSSLHKGSTNFRLLSNLQKNGFNSSAIDKLIPFRQKLSTWLKQDSSKAKLLSFRLSGLGLSLLAVPTLRRIECKSANTLNRRAEHIKREKLAEVEPGLALSDLWALMKPYLGWFLLAVVSAVATAMLNVEIPLRLGELINSIAGIIREQGAGHAIDIGVIQPAATRLVSLYVIQAALTFCYITFLSIMGERMAADLRVKLFDRLLHLDMAFYDAQKTGELSSRLSLDVHEFKSSFKLTVSQGLKTLVQVAGCFVSLIRLSPKMTGLTMAAVPIVILVGSICGALLRSLSRRAQAQQAIASSVADEAFGNIRTVRSFAMEQQESTLFKQEVIRGAAMQEQLGMGIGVFQAGTNLFLNGVVLGVLYGGSQLLSTGDMSPGGLMSFLVTAQTIQKSLSQLSIVMGTSLKGWTAAARVFQFANLVPGIQNSEGICIPHHSFVPDIHFENVNFVYPTRPGHVVFHELNLTIPAGKVVALCGPSGEGKSTITSLLERFYEPHSGRVTLGGKDLRELNTEWLRSKVIGLISQEPVLFHTSILENIRYGRPEATDEEVREAARLANADEFVSNFPHGYQTIVGERGTQLSGGQKQRVAIARALLKSPPVLILDEATSALDVESERLVRDALDRAISGRTVLVIAHRLSTIQNADIICVIKNGGVAEQGNHRELMRRKGLYYALVQAQSTND